MGRSAWAIRYAYCGGDPINRSDPSGLDWVDVNDNGEVIWQIEEDGFWGNYNKRAVVIGRKNGGMVDINQQFGGGQASFDGLQDIASKFWREYSDISASPVGVQNTAIGGAIDRVRGGGSITASSAAWQYSAAAAQGLGQGTVNTARAIVEPVTATVDTATNSVAAATGWNVSTQMSYTFEEGGLLDRVDAIQGTLERNGETGVGAYYTAGFYGSADLIGVADLSDAAVGNEVVFGNRELLGVNDLSGGDRALKALSGGGKLGATAAFAAGSLRALEGLRAGLRGRGAALWHEYSRFRGQGYSPRQARYLTTPYGTKRMGHHFLQRWVGRALGLPGGVMESPLNLLRPRGISLGRFYELHFRADRFFSGAAFPKAIGGNWLGASSGLVKPGVFGRLWYGSPTALKLTVGGAYLGGAAIYGLLNGEE